MNEIYLLLYSVMYKLSYLNLQFNNIPAFHRDNLLSFSIKKEDTRNFCKTAKISPMKRWDVIKMEGMIDLLTEIMVISFVSTLLKYLH